VYDVEDYVEEFKELTDMGLSCREIVLRCDPSPMWFRKNVYPHVKRALCITCHRHFNPSAIPRGTECCVTCRNVYTGFGRR
jgi:hypothetical protein